jgi:hypothetical protein
VLRKQESIIRWRKAAFLVTGMLGKDAIKINGNVRPTLQIDLAKKKKVT